MNERLIGAFDVWISALDGDLCQLENIASFDSLGSPQWNEPSVEREDFLCTMSTGSRCSCVGSSSRPTSLATLIGALEVESAKDPSNVRCSLATLRELDELDVRVMALDNGASGIERST